MKYYVVAIVSSLITWQLMWFFLFDEGRIQKWRLRKSIETIRKYISDNIKEGGLPFALTVTYRNRVFEVGILEEKVNSVYKYYHIFINGEDVAKYHCLNHVCLNSYYFEKTSRRDPTEICKILHAGNKYLKRLEKETTEMKIPEWKANSYFN
jgi:hypothetical protein